MKKYKVLIKDRNCNQKECKECNYLIVSLSKVEFENIKLLKTYVEKNIPSQEEAIKNYNNYIELLKNKDKFNQINFDLVLEFL